MNSRLLVHSFVVSVLVLVNCRTVICAAEGQSPAADPAQLAKAFEEFAKPGPQHAELQKMCGAWTAECTNFMGPQPTKSHGKAKFEMILGGRYLLQTFEGEFEGQKFDGIGVSGYDNAKKIYVSSWIDSMGTGIMASEGKYDAASKTMTEVGASSSPMGDMKLRTVTQCVDDQTMIMTMYCTQSGQNEQKTMEIKYVRVK